MLQSKAVSMFPKSFPFLIQNSSLPQTFIRDQSPLFAAHLHGNPMTIERLNESSSSNNISLYDDEHFQDTQFDIITLGKMSSSLNSTFRRCLRCSNFSRVFTTKPYPFLVYRLHNRCLCGGLFLLYTQSLSLNNNTTR
jgi:hypothetical protein